MLILFDVLHQNQQRNLPRRSQSTPNLGGKNPQVHDDNDKHCMGLFSLYLYEEFSSKQKEEKEDKEAQNEKIYEAKDISTQTFGLDRKLDKHLTTYKQICYVPDNYNVSWKINLKQIVAVSFGASIAGRHQPRKHMIKHHQT